MKRCIRNSIGAGHGELAVGWNTELETLFGVNRLRLELDPASNERTFWYKKAEDLLME